MYWRGADTPIRTDRKNQEKNREKNEKIQKKLRKKNRNGESKNILWKFHEDRTRLKGKICTEEPRDKASATKENLTITI